MLSIENMLKQALEMHTSGNIKNAQEIYLKILEAEPENADANYLLGTTYHQTGDNTRAESLILKAIALHPDRFSYHLNLGVIFEKAGKLNEALSAYSKALSLNPDIPDIHFNLGNVYSKSGKMNEAVHCFQKTLSLAPEHSRAIFNLANTLLNIGKTEQAEVLFKKAIAIQEDQIDYWIGLIHLYETSSRLGDAEECVNKIKKIVPEHPAVHRISAAILRRQGKPDKGLSILENTAIPIGQPDEAMRVHFELGKLYDKTGQYDKAFHNFLEGNRIQTILPNVADKRRYLNLVSKAAEWVSVLETKKTFPENSVLSKNNPVFLIGFTRSGTTLLDQVLDSHHAVQVLEEKSIMDSLANEITPVNETYPTSTMQLEEKRLQELQSRYFEEVEKYLPLDHNLLFIDKQPLNTVHLGLIKTIFPESKFIVSIRHPYDVCLSNFMQMYQLNYAMANFSTIQDSAVLYDKIMSIWIQSQELISPDYYVVKYEDLVVNFEMVVGNLIEFLGLEWDENVLHYREHALQRKQIATPSYEQVTRNIYTDSMYRWKSYSKYMKPVEPILNKYINHWGYETSQQ